MKLFAIAYFSTLIAFVFIDAIWLGLVAKKFYATQLGPLMRDDILFLPAGIFYLLYSAGIVLLAVRPEQSNLSLLNVAFYGAVVGFIAYGTYDVTNLATIKNWPALMSLVDLVWGTAISSFVAVAGAIAVRKSLGQALVW